LNSIVIGDFGAAAVLITLGAILGKVDAVQLLIICIFEIIFWGLSESLVFVKILASDVGGSMVVHAFGAYFGLGVSAGLRNKGLVKKWKHYNTGGYNSQLVAMVGTLFLWCYWPSFICVVSAMEGKGGNAEQRVAVNTILAITSSCVGAFGFSAYFNKGKFGMEDVLNATLAGGVIIGSTADMMYMPW